MNFAIISTSLFIIAFIVLGIGLYFYSLEINHLNQQIEEKGCYAICNPIIEYGINWSDINITLNLALFKKPKLTFTF